jgi:hypothetical protein
MRTQLSAFLLCVLVVSLAPAQDSWNVRPIGGYDTPFGFALSVAVSGDYVYVGWGDDSANGTQGLRVISVADPAYPVEVGYVKTPGNALAVVIEGEYAYVADDTGGLRIISVADPANPVEVGYYNKLGRTRDVAVVDGYAYVTDIDSGGLRVFSVSDPSHPVLVGYFNRPVLSSGVAVSGDHAYVVSDSLRVISISDPANPVQVGICEAAAGSTVAVSGYYAYIADMNFMLRVTRVSDPAHPIVVWKHPPQVTGVGVVVVDGYAYVAAEIRGLRVMSLADPGHPVEVGYYVDSQWTAFAEGVVATGDYAYVAYGVKGLQIFQYCGAGVEEMPSVECRTSNVATILNRASAARFLSSGVAFDAMGRKVANPQSGIFFVRERSAVDGERSAVTKVIVTR